MPRRVVIKRVTSRMLTFPVSFPGGEVVEIRDHNTYFSEVSSESPGVNPANKHSETLEE